MTAVVNPMVAGLGPTELLIILGVLILLFGAKKLPELARGSGRALRIFKAETKGLIDDDDESKTEEQKQIDAQNRAAEARTVESAHPTTEQRPSTDSDR
ncbi:MAG TPA: Sec-independent protein translocase subunit TatA [Nocardioidaceae bacterium]|jgi:sec-independent protein translocase protein TatA|nr:Sec-independent protein translocase subunit TatA [Nocardioidaceae bacterium]HJR38454.1 Sec-independent protein translocase subunit TatA [Nocardioidaceae bacterium]